MKILLDCCCGPCSIPATEQIEKEYKYSDITFFVNNSNITSKEEYEKRLFALKKVAEHYGKTLCIDFYNPDEWLEFVSFPGFEKEKEGGRRCEKCFEFRLRKAAEFSKKNKISIFTTSLSSGALKNADKINEIGKQIAKEFELKFIEGDWKENGGQEKSIEVCKQLGIYRQKYCGCKFSKKFFQ